MNASHLSPLRVLVTRPEPQQQELVAAIEAAAGHALHLPLIGINAVTPADNPGMLIQQIQQLDNYHILIFVSANAVTHGVAWIDRYWPQFPVGVQLVAIGPSTARQLETALGQPVVFAATGMTTEDLLELPVFADCADKRVAIFRGNGGRDLMAQTLTARGAVVEYLEVYRRQAVAYDPGAYASQINSHHINVLTVTSGESLQYLDQLLGDNKAEMSLLPLLVPSPRVAAQATDLGFQQVVDTGGADVASMMSALESIAAQMTNA